ncbi:MAG TPA: DedA family protein [Chromatiaceae bacterium]|jgi:undecaprenyl-diphosphatase|nr:DedA family protein [Chromatiaceae bacterium]HIA08968.1 DedA family protein [Chromatiaceae bacterium]HIB83079.1 DedA family protein [Chromatiaceae bacterium]HIN83187.1 DedA family protein [Chromatiales bacterium]HIO53608.1 DedA family protein [Chromatiales bacterium]
MLDAALTWIELNPGWAGVAVGCTAFVESLAVIGLIVPGVIIMFTIGGLIATDVLPFLPIAMWAAVGAILGDSVSYWLGRQLSDGLNQRWPFTRYPEMLPRGERFFQHWGLFSIALGRFFGPVRGTLPLVAGMLKLEPRRFFPIEIASGMVWSPAYLLPGMMIGTSLEYVSGLSAKIGVLLVILMGWWVLTLINRR